MKRKKYVFAIIIIALSIFYSSCTEKEPEPKEFMYKIGDAYEGGMIAYIFQSGDTRYVEGETHGLIAAPYDQSTNIEWGCLGTYIGGTSTALGTGSENTTAILNKCFENNAAYLCDTLTFNGFSDWFLPSMEELNILYTNRIAIGNFSDAEYWSSSENSINDQYAWIMDFANEKENNGIKNATFYVRAVRYF